MPKKSKNKKKSPGQKYLIDRAAVPYLNSQKYKRAEQRLVPGIIFTVEQEWLHFMDLDMVARLLSDVADEDMDFIDRLEDYAAKANPGIYEGYKPAFAWARGVKF